MVPAVNQRHFPLLHVLADKSVHVGLFFILALLSWNSVMRPARIRFAIVLGIGLLVGSTSEFLQRFFPGRDPSFSDVLINFGSAAIGALLVWNRVSRVEMRFVMANPVAKR
jgi:VanZ family protein